MADDIQASRSTTFHFRNNYKIYNGGGPVDRRSARPKLCIKTIKYNNNACVSEYLTPKFLTIFGSQRFIKLAQNFKRWIAYLVAFSASTVPSAQANCPFNTVSKKLLSFKVFIRF